MVEDEGDVQQELPAALNAVGILEPRLMDGMPSDDELLKLALSETSDPAIRLQLLAYRVAVLTREKEGLEGRLAKLEKAYLMGTGIFWALPVLGLLIGYLASNWGWLTRPWTSKGGVM